MFRFENIANLYYLLGLIPLALILLLAWRWYQKQRQKLGEQVLIDRIVKDMRAYGQKWVLIFPILITTLLVISWSNPQWGAQREKVQARSADIFIALDISNSMYCQDIAPNRLERSKRFAMQLVDKLRGERIGLILFAGNAYLQMPLTTDYAAAKLFIQSANPNLASTQGTAIAEAVVTAKESFPPEDNFHKALIIITDGEDHDAQAIEAVQQANQKGMIVFTIGVGTPEGSFIPMMQNGREDWKRDQSGQPVRTRLNETLMVELADKGGGSYIYLDEDRNVLEVLDSKVEMLEKKEYEERSFTAYESYFQWFLGLGLLLWVLEWMLNQRIFDRSFLKRL